MFELVNADCLEWLPQQPENTFHAVVTDPPFGLEFEGEELEKKRAGRGGSWRIPSPGRNAVPRFSELSPKELERMSLFFERFGRELLRVVRPGGHILVAANSMMSPWTFQPLLTSGFERRGEVVRLIQTLRGGDRPKGAEREFPLVCTLPRSAWEPWGLFRKPLSEKTVAQNLRKWGTGGLRRGSDVLPFTDVIPSSFPTRHERRISPHPSLKPQSWLRPLVRAVLPCAVGTILDPFAGSGAVLAAAMSQGFPSVGVERDATFHAEALSAIPRLANIDFDLPPEQDTIDFMLGN
jgi:site-specific DNA-methyltransferase (adenine-specific)